VTSVGFGKPSHIERQPSVIEGWELVFGDRRALNVCKPAGYVVTLNYRALSGAAKQQDRENESGWSSIPRAP